MSSTQCLSYVLLVGLCCVLTGILTAQPQSIMLLDDFEHFPINNLNRTTNVFPDSVGSTITRQLRREHFAFGHNGRSLQVNYRLSADSSGFCGLVSELPSIDLQPYHYLSFRVRSRDGGDMLLVELERQNGEKARVSVWDYQACGTGKQWQKVVIPLDAFWNLSERTEIVKMVISFESRSSYFNESPFEGEVHFDDFLVGTYFPGRVKLDPFDDRLPTNATGANNGDFGSKPMSTNYSNRIFCDATTVDCDCQLELSFDNGREDEFGGYFAIMGGGVDGFTPVKRSLAAYHHLHLRAFAKNAFRNPGNFKIELKEDSINKWTKRLLGIELSPKEFDLPLDEFQIEGQPDALSEWVIVFERNQQEVLTGEVLIDEVELRAESYQTAGTYAVTPPQISLINGNAPSGTLTVGTDTDLQFTGQIDMTDPRLESIRLQYEYGCKWHDIEVHYSDHSLSALQRFDFPAGLLPNDQLLQFRLVIEHFNGTTAYSPQVALTVTGDGLVDPGTLYRNAFEALHFLRAPSGVYADATVFEDTPYHPSSVATTGMGLISLCIAEQEGWIDNAEDLIIETLMSINGEIPGFKPERNAKGWFRHFIDAETGQTPNEWESEFSSIDSGILTAGALFCKKYFSDNSTIECLADNLYLSIDWNSMMADPASGGIYRIADLQGVGSGITLPFNEYMIVAWLAKNQKEDNTIANTLWENHYATPDGLPQSTYEDIAVLTDFPDNFLSGFVPQFNYYLCHYFTTDPSYHKYFDNAMRIDTLWWRNNTDAHCFEWGYGAGASPDTSGYHADDILDHPGTIFSPHIIGGFLPVFPEGIDHLVQLYQNGLSVRNLPDTKNTPVLWRSSYDDPAWIPKDIQGIDYASLLLGLAAHPNFLGPIFFQQNNDFDFPAPNPNRVFECITNVYDASQNLVTEISIGEAHPNPFQSFVTIPFSLQKSSILSVRVFNLQGQIVFDQKMKHYPSGKNQFIWKGKDSQDQNLNTGIYFIQFIGTNVSITKKICRLK